MSNYHTIPSEFAELIGSVRMFILLGKWNFLRILPERAQVGFWTDNNHTTGGGDELSNKCYMCCSWYMRQSLG